MSLSTNVTDLATAVATALKATRVLVNNNATDLSALTTTAKSNLVAAINEVAAAVGEGAGIDDGVVGTTTTYSSTKIVALDDDIRADLAIEIAALIDDLATATDTTWSSTEITSYVATQLATLVDSAPGTLDTLNELAAALGDDANFATTINTALGNRVRVDTAAQGLNSTQQGNARTNIAAAAASDLTTLTTNVGSTTADYVATFTAALA
jgi:hypothetical protein